MSTPTGRAIGGTARMALLTPEQRSAGARKAALAKIELAKLPKATHTGVIKIGEVELPCAVLDDGTRVLSERAITKAFGGKRGGSHWKRQKENPDGANMPLFLSAKNILSFVDNELSESLERRRSYRTSSGKEESQGIEAALLPKICNTLLKVRDAGKEHPSQVAIIAQADIIMRGLAEVGIAALVDEATGYQRDREKDALAKIMEAFVAKELQPWVKTFPSEYYEQLFRLYGINAPADGSTSRPQFFGHITNNVIYSRLAPELLPELKKAATKAEKKAKLHQWLTTELGHPKLREHMASIIATQKLAETPAEWMRFVDRVHPQRIKLDDIAT